LDLEQKEYTALLKLNRSELERETLLFKQGLTPERDVERAQFKADASSLEVDKTRVAGQTAQSKVIQVKAELDRSTVRAPISGIVMHRFAKLGASVVKTTNSLRSLSSRRSKSNSRCPRLRRVD